MRALILFSSLVLAVFQATSSWGAGLTRLTSFSTETKIKGGFTAVAGQLYFTAEKGGTNNLGYIGRLNPVDGSITEVFSFTTDAKPKGGLLPVGQQLYFLCEKGSATSGFGWIGRFDPATATMTEVYAYGSDVKPKSGLVRAGDDLCFATEKGGATGTGSVERFRADGTVATVANLSPAEGIKVESLIYDESSNSVYLGAREGGDLTQLAGKGAGSLMKVSLTSGTLTTLANLGTAEHGAKIRGLHQHDGRLWFICEEGGDLSLNSGKGGGTVVSFDPLTATLTRVHVFDGLTAGLKPKGSLRVGKALYLATEQGGSTGLGAFSVLENGMVSLLADFDSEIGAKPDHFLSLFEDRILIPTELGTPGFLGGIAAYELPTVAVIPPLHLEITANQTILSWPSAATQAFQLERSAELNGTSWHSVDPVRTRVGDRVQVILGQELPVGFFRLR